MEYPRIERRTARRVMVGNVAIGGGVPVSIQSMTSTFTRDVDATVAQIQRLAAAGCEIVRVAVPTPADTAALPEILRQVRVPVVADVHFHFDRALEAVMAGVHKIRLNPGNIRNRAQVLRVLAACRERGVPVRVGVNEGSVVERHDRRLHDAERQRPLVELMVEKLTEYLRTFEEARFEDVVLSAKSSDAVVCVEAYRAIARRFDFPLHLGVTHAGDADTGTIRSAAALGTLLCEGIGDTLRISFAGDPEPEVRAAKELLCSLRLRDRDEAEIIACPTCGRTEVDLPRLLADVRQALAGRGRGLRVAVMGCIVNGPGEAEGSHVAVCCGQGRGAIYVDGRPVATVAEDQITAALVEQVRQYKPKT